MFIYFYLVVLSYATIYSFRNTIQNIELIRYFVVRSGFQLVFLQYFKRLLYIKVLGSEPEDKIWSLGVIRGE